MKTKVKHISEGQIIKDASGQHVVINRITESQAFGGGTVLAGTTVKDVRNWSCRYINPDEEIEVVLSNSNS